MQRKVAALVLLVLLTALLLIPLPRWLTLLREPLRTIPAEDRVRTGMNMLVVQLPLAPPIQQEEIIVQEDVLYIRRSLVDPTQRGSSSELTPAHWQALKGLRQSWCQTPPADWQGRPDARPVYTVAMRCGTNPQRTRIIVLKLYIPVGELPPELRDLIRAVPSPTCAEPFCGWEQ